MADLLTTLEPPHPLPPKDGWGYPYSYTGSVLSYTLVSHSKCGRIEDLPPEKCQPGATLDFEADIVIVDGVFCRSPEGMATANDRLSSPNARPWEPPNED
jgi:hypothetical protein